MRSKHAITTEEAQRLKNRLLDLQAKGYDGMTSAEFDEWARLRQHWPVIKDALKIK